MGWDQINYANTFDDHVRIRSYRLVIVVRSLIVLIVVNSIHRNQCQLGGSDLNFRLFADMFLAGPTPISV